MKFELYINGISRAILNNIDRAPQLGEIVIFENNMCRVRKVITRITSGIATYQVFTDTSV